MGLKKTTIKTAVIFVGVLSGTSEVCAAPTDPVTGGKINFVGEVVDTACGVSPDSSNMTVPMGQVPISAITFGPLNAGKQLNKKDFQIELTDCSIATQHRVKVAFMGEQDVHRDSLYKVGNGNSTATNASQGLGLAIMDQSGKKIVPSVSSEAIEFSEGTNIIPFTAAYETDGAITAKSGDASVVMDFELTYQ